MQFQGVWEPLDQALLDQLDVCLREEYLEVSYVWCKHHRSAPERLGVHLKLCFVVAVDLLEVASG